MESGISKNIQFRIIFQKNVIFHPMFPHNIVTESCSVIQILFFNQAKVLKKLDFFLPQFSLFFFLREFSDKFFFSSFFSHNFCFHLFPFSSLLFFVFFFCFLIQTFKHLFPLFFPLLFFFHSIFFLMNRSGVKFVFSSLLLHFKTFLFILAFLSFSFSCRVFSNNSFSIFAHFILIFLFCSFEVCDESWRPVFVS